MTMTLPEHDSRHQTGEFTDYEALLKGARREAEPVPALDYQELAAAISAGRKYAISHGHSMAEADTELKDSFVYDQDDERLARFAEVAIEAHKMSAMQGWLNRHPIDAQTPAEKIRGREFAYARTEYNHLLRETIYDARETLDRPEFVSLLNQATDGRVTNFLNSAVTGVVAEIALMDTLYDRSDVSGLAYTNVDDDFHGIDLTAVYKGRKLAFDVKFDRTSKENIARTKLLGEVLPLITIAVPVESIDNLGVSERGKHLLDRKLDTVLAAVVH